MVRSATWWYVKETYLENIVNITTLKIPHGVNTNQSTFSGIRIACWAATVLPDTRTNHTEQWKRRDNCLVMKKNNFLDFPTRISLEDHGLCFTVPLDSFKADPMSPVNNPLNIYPDLQLQPAFTFS